MEKVCVAVCTAQRPAMLRRCLISLAGQICTEDIELFVLVVDNNAAPDARAVVDAVGAGAPRPIVYVHEPEAGIPIARNRAVEAALAMQADWLAFIDDDEEAPSEWIAELIGAGRRYAAAIIQGGVKARWDGPLPPRLLPPRSLIWEEGKVPEFCSTANIAFRTSIFDGAPSQRFNPAFRFSGGSDTEFCRRQAARGVRIVATSHADIVEWVPAARLTLSWQFERMMRTFANDIQIEALNGKIFPLPQRIWAGVEAAAGFVNVALLPLHRLGGPAHFDHEVQRQLRRLARRVGRFRGMIGWLPQPYRRIQGE